jgi:hypothetical protein
MHANKTEHTLAQYSIQPYHAVTHITMQSHIYTTTVYT